MGAIQLQPRPLYGIGTVARLTGVKPDTLRIWERRYQLGASHKSASGRRQYTQADLEHLQLVAALVAAGTRIGEIAGLERRTLEALLRNRAPADSDAALAPKLRVLFIGEALRREVLGSEHVDRSLENARRDPFLMPIQQLTVEVGWGTVWSRPGLPRKTRSLLCIAFLTAQGKHGELRTHLVGALNNGATREEIGSPRQRR